ncbi:hypothetical protein GGC65_004480 [Sphingopyxis sp. OAS728]|uniref:hypothetical protein n=1 Tax=Sphingopyxis sp. OAS728 TaxID=2663823 RepID=UPI00178A237C|nr:hypothetical protein [Sphingopyxis sp. OAS728]MBE1530024.1 hypothetical protein [Sphingopyxis sp. OAS728]
MSEAKRLDRVKAIKAPQGGRIELCPLRPLRQAQDRLKAKKDTDARVANVSFVALGEVAEADYFKERA